MTLPFTIEEFLKAFQDHNAAIWPVQILAWALGLVILAAPFVRRDGSRRVAMAALGLLWASDWLPRCNWEFPRISDCQWPERF